MKIFNFNKYLLVIIGLILVDCSIGGFIANWRDAYWSSLSDKNLHKWTYLIFQFCIAALVSCFISGYSQYLISLVSLRVRTKLTRASYKLKNTTTEGYSQRIQEDCMNYPLLYINLLTLFFRNTIMIVVFSYIILSHLSFYYLLIPVLYSLVGTFIAGKIASPLISLNYVRQVFEAKFRNELSKINYKNVHNNNYMLFKQTKYLQYFQSFYNQITIIFPHLLLAVLYFSGKITFGVFMQVAASILELTNALSTIINSFSDINNFISCRRRLREIKLI